MHATPFMTVKGVSAILVAAVAVAGFSQGARAQSETPERFLVYVAPTLKHGGLSASERVLSFNLPVEIPGARLPAGVYIFRLLGPQLLQVQSITRSKVYATFFTIPSSPVGDTSRESISFEVTGENETPRIVAWHVPGAAGHEFLYPKPKRKAPEREERETEEEVRRWR